MKPCLHTNNRDKPWKCSVVNFCFRGLEDCEEKIGVIFLECLFCEHRVFASMGPVSCAIFCPPKCVREDSSFRYNKRLGEEAEQSILEGQMSQGHVWPWHVLWKASTLSEKRLRLAIDQTSWRGTYCIIIVIVEAKSWPSTVERHLITLCEDVSPWLV